MNSRKYPLRKHQQNVNLEQNSPEINQENANNGQEELSPQSNLLACPVCKKAFKEIRYLIEHLHLHENETISQQKTPSKPSDLDVNPMKSQPNFDELSCQICGKKYRSKKTLKTHLKLHAGERPFMCEFCEKSFPVKAQLNLHLNKHHKTESGKRRYSCEKCARCFSGKKSLAQHLQNPCSQTFACPLCPKVFKRRCNLILHLRYHAKDICFEEGESGKHPPVVNSNQISSTNKGASANTSALNAFSCGGCKKVFMDKMPLACDNCNKEFSERTNLHATRLKPETQAVENELGKKFRRKSILLAQPGKKNLKCEICKKTFAYLSLLRMHVQTHTGKKPHKCPKCGKGFQLQSSVTQHLLGHSDKRSCPICSKTFENIGCLTVHLQHHNERQKSKGKYPEANNQISNIKEYPQNTEILVCEVNPEILASEENSVQHPRNTDDILEGCFQNEKVEKRMETEIPVKLVQDSHKNQSEQESDLVSELSMLSGKRCFKCNLCEQSFNSRSNLRQHFLSHKEKNSCQEHGTCFTRNSHLRRHLPVRSSAKQHAHTKQKHSEESAKKADGKKMGESDIQISNTEEKASEKHPSNTNTNPLNVELSKENYLCEMCGMNFSLKKSFAAHLLHHFKRKSFKCKVCEKSFFRLRTLNKHLSLHSVKKSFPCEDCGISYSYEGGLTRHLTSISLINPNEMKKKKHYLKTALENFLEKQKETTILKETYEEGDIRERPLDKQPPSKNTISCKMCQKEFVGEKPGACDKCQVELPDKPSNDHAKDLNENPSDKIAFKCIFCSEAFSRISCLQVHILCHSAEKVTCGVCGDIFHSIFGLYNHLRLHTGEKPHKCNRCGKSFPSKTKLDIHLRAHSGEKPFLCEICGTSFKNRLNFVKHRRTHTGEERPVSRNKPFECEFCHERYLTNFNFKKHRCAASSSQETNKEGSREKCSCHVCGKELLKNSLKSHLRMHSEGKRFECEVCGKSYCRRSHLNDHLRIHTGEKPFSCEVCGNKFATKKILKEHYRRIHPDAKPEKTNVKTFACEFCPRKFSAGHTLKDHLNTHTGEKPYTCDICQKSFAQSSTLNTHRLIHEGIKAFLCEQCSKSFYTSRELKRHLKICNGERPFVCEFCQKAFHKSSNLALHKRIHTGEKPVTCKVCNKSFRTATNLKRHSMTHTGERPYQCEVCQKGFTQSFNLKVHLRTHSREAPTSAGLSDHPNVRDAPMSSGLSDRTHGRDVSSMPSSLPNPPIHSRDASMLLSLPNRADGCDASLLPVLPHCTQNLVASSSLLPNRTRSFEGHTSSGISNQQLSGGHQFPPPHQPVRQDWYY